MNDNDLNEESLLAALIKVREMRAEEQIAPPVVSSDEAWRRRVGLAMKVEFLCVLEGWIEGDEDLLALSPRELVARIEARLRQVACGVAADNGGSDD